MSFQRDQQHYAVEILSISFLQENMKLMHISHFDNNKLNCIQGTPQVIIQIFHNTHSNYHDR